MNNETLACKIKSWTVISGFVDFFSRRFPPSWHVSSRYPFVSPSFHSLHVLTRPLSVAIVWGRLVIVTQPWFGSLSRSVFTSASPEHDAGLPSRTFLHPFLKALFTTPWSTETERHSKRLLLNFRAGLRSKFILVW